jgi:RNA polymerase sigma factor (TIGR02999 family)
MQAGQAQPGELSPRHDITDALVALRHGAPDALDRLTPLVYEELRKIAHRQLGAERSGHTLSTTALVHEAYLKLVDQTRAQWSDRAQFFAIAARAMRRILVDYARRHKALRRGGAQSPLSLEDLEDSDAIAAAERADEFVALDEALERLTALDERLARVVECRFFAGLTEAETAEVLGVTPRTVARDWVKARGWLYQELHSDAG